jgi:hypothetical protein
MTRDKFSPIKAYELFFDPLRRSDSKISLAEWVVANNVMPQAEVTRLKKLLTRMTEIDTLVASGKGLDNLELAKKMGSSIELLASALGSATASKLYRTIGGDTGGTSSLAVVSRGSSLAIAKARQIMTEIPAITKQSFFMEVLENPDLAIEFLEIAKTQKEADRKAEMIVDFALSRGYLVGRQILPYVAPFGSRIEFDQYESIEPPTLQEKIEDAALEKNKPIGAGPTRRNVLPRNDQGASLAGPPTTQASAVPLSSPKPVNSAPVNRERYAALFPNDPISNMITQTPAQKPVQFAARGGIASLMR